MLCKMAQVSLIQRTHVIGLRLYPRYNGPQFPGQFSGGSPYHHRLASNPNPNRLQAHSRGYDSIQSRANGALSFHSDMDIESFQTGKPYSDTFIHLLSIMKLNRIPLAYKSSVIKNCIVTQAAVAESLFTLQASCRISLPG